MMSKKRKSDESDHVSITNAKKLRPVSSDTLSNSHLSDSDSEEDVNKSNVRNYPPNSTKEHISRTLSSKVWPPPAGDYLSSSSSSSNEIGMDKIAFYSPPETNEDPSLLYNPNHNFHQKVETASPIKSYEYTKHVKQEDNVNKTKIKLPYHDNELPKKRLKPQHEMGEQSKSTVASTTSSDTTYSMQAKIMMEKMGYNDTKGLGVREQGPTNIIEASKQKGRRGLGFELTEFSDEGTEWNFDNDPAPVEEEVQWCPVVEEPPLQLEELKQWIKIGPKKRTIDDETEFCDEKMLRNLLSCKTVFDSLSQQEMEQARERSNAYETIRGAMFMNRAAIKLANMDTTFDWIFSDPKIPNTQKSLILPEEPFYFIDMCAGPGGFSEYLLWRRQWRSKGFGFTLKGKSDFRLHDFLMGKPETFDPYYGVKDISDDGDITKPENIDALQAYVLKCTMKLGVHVATADGGFSVEGQENIQEILSKQLYLCQFLGALSVLRPGGNFVCKLFDLFTPFSVGLVYLMYRTFNQISIHKPVSSRPANSERYIICKGLRESVRDIVRVYMYEINSKQCKHRNDTEPNDIQSIVPLDIIKSNHEFCNYIIASNNTLGENQIRNLRKIRAFVSNPKLIDTRQSNIRQQCLTLWNIPDEQRPKRRRLLYNDIYNELFGRLDQGIENYILNTPNLLKKCVLNQNQMASLFDYRCVLSLGDPVLLLSCGRSQVYSIDLRHKNKCWTLLEKTPFKIELPPYTLLLGEKVLEDFREGRTLRQKPAIYIIDAYFIGNENILMNNKGPVVFIDRFRSMKLFEKTINKPSRYDLAPIRVSEQLRCEHLDANITKLCESGHYDQIDSEKLWYVNESVVENKPRVQVHGIWFFKFVQCPWTILWGRSKQQKYFHNQNTRVSESVAPSDYSHVASLRSMLENSFYWDFNTNFRDDTVSKSNMISFIRGKTDQQQRPSQQQQHNHT